MQVDRILIEAGYIRPAEVYNRVVAAVRVAIAAVILLGEKVLKCVAQFSGLLGILTAVNMLINHLKSELEEEVVLDKASEKSSGIAEAFNSYPSAEALFPIEEFEKLVRSCSNPLGEMIADSGRGRHKIYAHLLAKCPDLCKYLNEKGYKIPATKEGVNFYRAFLCESQMPMLFEDGVDSVIAQMISCEEIKEMDVESLRERGVNIS